MDRRRFLKGSLVGLSGLTLPSWLGCAFRPGGVEGDDAFEQEDAKALLSGGLPVRLAPFAEAYLRAKSAGKPLLVFVIPENDWLKHDRGTAFGELLNHGDDEDLAALALCEVFCAKVADLHELVPGITGEPLMI